MHVVMLSDWETRGGAAIAASRLATGLVQAGARVTRLVCFADARERQVWHTQTLTPAGFTLRRGLRRALPLRARTALDRMAVPAASVRLEQALAQLRPDVIHLHNLHGGIGAGWSPALLASAAQAAPVAWTLHDMWSFTGRCVYNMDCRRYRSGCDAACPTPGEYPALPADQIAAAWAERRELISATPRLAAIAPSTWIAEVARSGLWGQGHIVHIPHGVPTTRLQPQPRMAARQQLGLNYDGPLLLVIAPELDAPRKGGALLMAALAELAGTRYALMSIGQGQLPPPPAPATQITLGPIKQTERLALALSAADLLMVPALQETFAQTAAEALACGTPVVALPVGAMPELVRPGQSGWLAEAVAAPALAAALRLALAELASGCDLRASCRALAEHEYNLELYAQRHIELYATL
jgi:glycosyltransferase involved in cell wall biosynthesis